nr:uncharacterized protein LOC113827764 [Penaeus vannamei]
MNGVGLEFNHLFGFGVLDAGAMVALARDWVTVPPRYHCQAGIYQTPRKISVNEPSKSRSRRTPAPGATPRSTTWSTCRRSSPQRQQTRRRGALHRLADGHQVHDPEQAAERRRLPGRFYEVALHDHPHLGREPPGHLEAHGASEQRDGRGGLDQGMDPDAPRDTRGALRPPARQGSSLETRHCQESASGQEDLGTHQDYLLEESYFFEREREKEDKKIYIMICYIQLPDEQQKKRKRKRYVLY